MSFTQCYVILFMFYITIDTIDAIESGSRNALMQIEKRNPTSQDLYLRNRLTVNTYRQSKSDLIHPTNLQNSTTYKRNRLFGDKKINAYDWETLSKGNSIFGGWSRWSKCSKNCRQSRRRRCRFLHICGGAVMKERKPCSGGKCQKEKLELLRAESPKSPIFYLPSGTTPHDKIIMRYNTVYYSKWSPWSQCSEVCLSSRQRSCKFPKICGYTIIQEDSLCKNPQAKCKSQKLYQKFKTHFQISKDSKVLSPATDLKDQRALRSKHFWERKRLNHTSKSSSWEPVFVAGSNFGRMGNSKSISGNKKAESASRKRNIIQVGRPHALPKECGFNGFSGAANGLRILGGLESVKGKWPWQVAIMNKYEEVFCGGTLISSQWVLTAAHCVKKRMNIRIAEHDLSQHDGMEREFLVNKSIIHPLYDPMTVDNDIALLRLPRPVNFDKGIGAACIPSLGDHPKVGTYCTILGWGKKRHSHHTGSNVLNEAKIPIVSRRMCRQVYHDYYITNNMFCAGFRKGFIDSCAGDSGGPLLCQHQDRWYVHGVTSFGDGCGRRGKYGIYSKVENYRMWINDVIAAYAPPLRSYNIRSYDRKSRMRTRQKHASTGSRNLHSKRKSINVY